MQIVYITFRNLEEAEKVGDILVRERIARCVNIIPKIKSIYEWKNEIYHEEEAVLLVKIKDENYQKLEDKIKKIHSYELPACFSIKIERGLKEYLDWIEGI